jgi:uracil permease
LVFTLIGNATGNADLQVLNFAAFENMKWIPDFSFLKAFEGFKEIKGEYIATIAVAYIPVAFVVFAEHIADHKNLSSIIGQDLLEEPGLHRTLLGDGIGSIAGAFFGGCPNTTYGESIGCVAITGNASVITILATAILAIAASFFGPFVTFLSTIPSCVMGGVCITLYGFIAVSGLKMLQPVDLNDNRNLFTASVILIAGIGGMQLGIGSVTLTKIACALILGIVVNLIFNRPKKEDK